MGSILASCPDGDGPDMCRGTTVDVFYVDASHCVHEVTPFQLVALSGGSAGLERAVLLQPDAGLNVEVSEFQGCHWGHGG